MSTFAGIAQQGAATMAAMAPGVSAALITTVAGLLVGFHRCSVTIGSCINLRVFHRHLD